MKAIVYEAYGGPEVVHVGEVADPTPRAREVLVRIRATTVESGDARLRALRVPRGFGPLVRPMIGFTGPRRRVLGLAFAGEVVSLGPGVTKLAPGDAIFGLVGMDMGCHAELRTLREDACWAAKPASLSFAEAAALPFGGHTVLDFFRRGDVKRGERVLVVGASGAVGVMAVQIAKRHLECDVTGVTSAKNAALVRALGADRVVEYTREASGEGEGGAPSQGGEDFTTLGETWDVIVDTTGTAPYSRSRAVLRPGGRLLAVLGTLGEMLRGGFVGLTSDKRVVSGTGPESAADLRLLADLVVAGKLRPVVSEVLPFARASEAHAIVDSGHKVGAVVLEPGAP